jgi:hypothetical protein
MANDQHSSTRRLTVATYNTYRERKGRDPALDALLSEQDTLICLQEVSWARAWEIKRRFGRRAYLSPVMQCWQLLVIVLPADACFVEHRTVYPNSYVGLLPSSWSLGRVIQLYPERKLGWSDGLSPRAVQIARMTWQDREIQLINTHLPYEASLRDRCLSGLADLVDGQDALLVGDLNGTTEAYFLVDLLQATGLRPAGPDIATHDDGRRIDYVLFRGGFREVGYSLEKGLSDHRLIRVELEA